MYVPIIIKPNNNWHVHVARPHPRAPPLSLSLSQFVPASLSIYNITTHIYSHSHSTSKRPARPPQAA